MASLRLLLVNRALPWHVAGGLERHVEDLALGLAGAGCDVHLLTAPLPLEEVKRYRAAGVQPHTAPFARPDRYTLDWLRFAPGRIRDLHAHYRFDLIHGQEFGLGFWRRRAGDPPVVLTVHGTITSETPLHPDVYPLLETPAARLAAWTRFGRRLLFRPAFHRTLEATDRILVDSEFTFRELTREQPKLAPRLRPVPLAVRMAAAPPDREAARRELGWRGLHLLTVGRLEWQKGQDLALKALARLRDLEWHYTIAGAGAMADRLAAQVPRYLLQGRVSFAGRVEERVKAHLLAGADLFLWPERAHPAFGLAGLEALLSGTPVLATRRGAIPEVLAAGGGWLAERPTPEAFAAALEPLLTEPAALARAREGLRQSALNHFRFEAMIEAVMKLYRELLEDRVAAHGST